ncbi:MAG: hypothetical protein KAT28_05445 [Candidatus Aenigmarchaeota archaeon]|nr:hypothetical protein [Candidatus Aenigmarchaeota archaeon]
MSNSGNYNGSVDKESLVIEANGFHDEVYMNDLLDKMLKAGPSLYTDKKLMEYEIYKGLVLIAEYADETSTPKNHLQSGEAMRVLNNVFFERGLDIGDYKKYKLAPGILGYN